MSKARDLADLIAAGNPLADGTVEVADISDLTATAAELNLMDGVTATTAELNYVDGVTSNVQTQIDTKAPTASPTFTGDVTFDTDTLFVDSTNNRVGMGTSSPAELLNLSSAEPVLRFTDSDDNNYHHLFSSSDDFYINADRNNTGSGNLIFRNGGTSERMRIDSSGNVGVGTTSPNGKFEVNAGTGNSFRIARDGDNLVEIGNYNATDGYRTTRYFSSDHIFNTTTAGAASGTEKMRLDSSGNLGIGTTSPAHTLDVSGELKATSYNETYVSLTAAATVDIDCESGNVFALSTTQNTTFTFSNPPASGTAFGFILKLTAGGTHTITWPTSVDWKDGTAPDAPASGETDVLVFLTVDGGTTWYGALAIDAAS